MSFLRENFSPVGANSSKGQSPSQWAYKSSTDSIATIKAGNYFGEAALDLNTNDMIHVIATDGMAIMHVTSSDPVTKTVVVDSNVISNQGGADNSASFQNIYQLSDFPVQDATTITLENGVNYLVYIEGPVTSPKSFVLQGTYDKGGSLIYMGAAAVLLWNYSGAGTAAMIKGTAIAATGIFKLSRMEFSNTGTGDRAAMEITGESSSVLMQFLEIRETGFFSFQSGAALTNIAGIDIEDMDIDPVSAVVVNPALETTDVERIEIRNADLKSTGTVLTMVLGTERLIRGRVLNCNFFTDIDDADKGCIVIADDNEPLEPFVMANCNILKNGANKVVRGFNVMDMGRGVIESILDNGGGFAQVTTVFPNDVTTADKLIIYGTNAYNSTQHTITSVNPGARTILLTTAHTDDNFAGNFLQGSQDGNSSVNIRVLGCNGITSPIPAIATIIAGQVAVRSVGLGFLPLVYTAGTIDQAKDGFLKDFKLLDYTTNKIQYLGLQTVSVRVGAHFAIEQTAATAARTLTFRFLRTDSGGTPIVESSNWECSRIPLTNDPLFDYSFETNMRMNPLDIIVPEFKSDVADTDFVIPNMTFNIEA